MDVIDYCNAVSSPESDVCKALRTYGKEKYPALEVMISGPLENALLKFLIASHSVKNILDIGTFVGYSALSMAESLPQDGRLYTLDINTEYVSVAKEYWERSSSGAKITSVIGPALEFLYTSSVVFDLIFIDADKESYLQYFKAALARLSANGMIVIDNALWSGKVLEQNPLEESTKAVKAVNQFIRERSDLQSVLLPLRDGVHLVTRIPA